MSGEKADLFFDPEIQQELKNDEVCLCSLDIKIAGSVEMAGGKFTRTLPDGTTRDEWVDPGEGQDALLPNSDVTLALYQDNQIRARNDEYAELERQGKTPPPNTNFAGSRFHFVTYSYGSISSMLVLLTWAEYERALETSGYIVREADGYPYLSLSRYMTDLHKRTWIEAGYPALGDRLVTINTPDPTKEGAGTLFAGLLANVQFQQQKLVSAKENVPRILPATRELVGTNSLLPSRGDAFMQAFLNNGRGANPIAVAFANQMGAYNREHEESLSYIQSRIVVVIPKPTVYANHPVLILSENGLTFFRAFIRNPKIRKIAAQRYMFNVGLAGVDYDPAHLAKFAGVPADVDDVFKEPNLEVQQALMLGLK